VLDEKFCDRTSHSSYRSYCNLLFTVPSLFLKVLLIVSYCFFCPLRFHPLTVLKIVPTGIKRNKIEKICCTRVNENFSSPGRLSLISKGSIPLCHQSSWLESTLQFHIRSFPCDSKRGSFLFQTAVYIRHFQETCNIKDCYGKVVFELLKNFKKAS